MTSSTACVGEVPRGAGGGSEPAHGGGQSAEVALLLAPYRPDDAQSDGLFRFTAGYEVEAFDATNVRVHFTRTGPDKVKATDSDADGVPDAVQTVARTYEDVIAFYEGLGFRGPVTDLGAPQGDGGDGRLDVYLVDFAGASDGAWVRERCEVAHARCSGYVVQENDYTGYGYPTFSYATRILASHELFHAVQAAYDADQGSNWSEATAVWATERFDDTLSDFESFTAGWLALPSRSIDQDPIGPVDAYAYGLSIFAQFLWERFGDEVHLAIWEGVEDGAGGVADPKWRDVVEGVLARDFETTFAAEWVTFAQWVLRCGQGASGGETFASAARLDRVARETANLPFSKEKLRVYATSLQVWSVVPGGRPEVVAALVEGAAGDADGLVLVVGKRKGNAVVTEVVEGLEAVIDTRGQDEIIVAVVSTNREGASKRPGLCLGTVDEVATCRAGIEPVAEVGPEVVEEAEVVEIPDVADVAEEASDIGSSDADASDAGVVESGAKDDGGCAGGGASGLGVAVVLGALWAWRRRVGGGTHV
ncbi:MAG: hypothetical protein JNJ59_25130 [Deltaproteobacteria bacterium]|nr:hypothetical protein [Deltaproteobacteria bacterium]